MPGCLCILQAHRMEVDGESIDYMDENPRVLMLKEERTHWELVTIVEATTKLKNWAWEGAAHPMENSLEKIKTIEPLTPAKNIISISIESVCCCFSIPIESISIESIKNSTPSNVISNSAYLLALNFFISEIGKETFINEKLKQGRVEPIKEETQPVKLTANDEPKMA